MLYVLYHKVRRGIRPLTLPLPLFHPTPYFNNLLFWNNTKPQPLFPSLVMKKNYVRVEVCLCILCFDWACNSPA